MLTASQPHLPLRLQRLTRFNLHSMSMVLLCVAAVHIAGCGRAPQHMTEPEVPSQFDLAVEKAPPETAIPGHTVGAIRRAPGKKQVKPKKPSAPISSSTEAMSIPPLPSKPPAIGGSGG